MKIVVVGDENQSSTSESDVSHISKATSSSSEKSMKSVTEYSTEESGSSDDVESDSTPIYHTLPFKVIGKTHTTKTQDCLCKHQTKALTIKISI